MKVRTITRLIMPERYHIPHWTRRNRVSHLSSLKIIVARPHVLIYSPIDFELKDQSGRVNSNQKIEAEPKIAAAIDSDLQLVLLFWDNAAIHFESAKRVYIYKEGEHGWKLRWDIIGKACLMMCECWRGLRNHLLKVVSQSSPSLHRVIQSPCNTMR